MKTGFTKKQASMALTFAICLLFSFSAVAQDPVPFFTEDFGNGFPAGWTTEDADFFPPDDVEALWTWCSDPDGAINGVTGCHTVWDTENNMQEPFMSTTASNGFMTVDSDAAGNVDHLSVLTTAALDCSGQPVVVARFETMIGVFTNDPTTNAFIQVSTNGTDWTGYVIFPDLDVGTTNPPFNRWSFNPTVIEVDISDVAANQPQVFIRWVWDGMFEYHWNIDDFALQDALTPPPVNETSVSSTFHAPSYATPRAHIQPVQFGGFVSNNGVANQSNVTLQAVVTDSDGNVVYDESEVLPSLDAGFEDSLVLLSQEFTPPSSFEQYEVTYNLFQDEADEEPFNNIAENSFVVTDFLFAKDNDMLTTAFVPNDDDGNNLSNYQAGAFYQLLQADSVTSIQFSMAENDDLLENNTVTLVLYQVNCDVFGDEACQNNFDDSQLTAVGVAFYTFTTDDENFDIITVDLLDFNTFGAGPLPVEAGIYFAMVDVAQGTTNPLLFTSVSDPGYSSEQIFSAVRFSPTDQPIGPGSDAIWRLEGFGPEAGIVMRLGVTGDGINTSILDPEELPAELSIFPSPANELLTVDVRLETPATNATVRIVDLMGRTIESRLFDNLNREVMTFDVSSLPAGTYIFNVTTAKGVKSQRFSVAH